jgi:hypothetical protein
MGILPMIGQRPMTFVGGRGTTLVCRVPCPAEKVAPATLLGMFVTPNPRTKTTIRRAPTPPPLNHLTI